MKRLERFLSAFRKDLIHFSSVIDDAVHGRWDPVVEMVPEVVEAPVIRCTKADLSAASIIAFVAEQKNKSTVFDGYVASEKRREVMTDE